MNFDELATNMTPDIYNRLRDAIQLGRWPNEVPLTKEQKALCLEAIIKYEISNDIPLEERTGHISQGCKTTKTETISTVNIDSAMSSTLKNSGTLQ